MMKCKSRRGRADNRDDISDIELVQAHTTRIGQDLDICAIVELLLPLRTSKTRTSIIRLSEIVARMIAPLQHAILARHSIRQLDTCRKLAIVLARQKVFVAI